MRNLVTRLIITLAFGSFMAVSASALDLDANIDVANSAVANGITVDADGNGTADLTDGDIIAIEVVVSNASMDDITGIFSSLVYDTTDFSFVGGAFTNVLTELTCTGFLCSPATLAPGIPAPFLKPNSPDQLGTGITGWVQSLAHANVNGTMGTGPDVGVLLAFSVIGNVGTAPLTIGADLTQGDAVGTTGGAIFQGTVNLDGVTINVPEPSTLAASIVSLGIVALVAIRRRALA